MSFYGSGARYTLEAQFTEHRLLTDSQVAGTGIDGMQLQSIGWTKTDMHNTSANDTVWENCTLQESVFKHCGFMRSSWRETDFLSMRLEGLTLIRNNWDRVSVTDTVLTQSCMARNRIRNSVFRNCTISNIEGGSSIITDTLFMGTVFSLDRGAGMNGFIQSVFQNCIFYNCYFEGQPLEGASVQNSVFCRCSWRLGEMMNILDTAGIDRKKLTEADVGRSIADMDDSMVRTALVRILLEDADGSANPAAVSAQREKSYSNFAQAVLDLKDRYDFRELDLFSTEADPVYVQTSERKILLTDTSVPGRPDRSESGRDEIPGRSAAEGSEGQNGNGEQRSPGRFSYLEFE